MHIQSGGILEWVTENHNGGYYNFVMWCCRLSFLIEHLFLLVQVNRQAFILEERKKKLMSEVGMIATVKAEIRKEVDILHRGLQHIVRTVLCIMGNNN